MKRFLAGFLAAAVLLAAGAAFVQTGTEAITFNLGGDLDRVKLRAAPNTDAAVLGQYFAFVKAEVLKENGEWWRVRIGDREGYMMSRFLTKDVPDGDTFVQGQSGRVCGTGNAALPLYAAPDQDAATLAVMDAGNLYVLGTVNEDWLQVLYRQEGAQPVTGYASSADIAMTENLATVAVGTDDPAERLNLRALPRTTAASLGLFYGGAVMDRLFDDHVNGDGWTRVRIGDLVGYAADEFLSLPPGTACRTARRFPGRSTRACRCLTRDTRSRRPIPFRTRTCSRCSASATRGTTSRFRRTGLTAMGMWKARTYTP